MRNIYSYFIIICSVISFISIIYAENPVQVLGESGIHGIAQWIRSSSNLTESSKFENGNKVLGLDNSLLQTEQGKKSDGFGVLLGEKINDLKRMPVSLQQVDDLVAVRDWVCADAGYENIVLGCQTKNAALDKLFLLLDNSELSNPMIEQRLALIGDSRIENKFWTESINVVDTNNVAPMRNVKGSDLDQVRNALQIILSKNDGALLPGTLTYQECYTNKNMTQMAWNSVFLDEKYHALECCLQIREATGEIPSDRDSFIQALKIYASDCLRRRDTLTGQITPHKVWRIWSQIKNEGQRQSKYE